MLNSAAKGRRLQTLAKTTLDARSETEIIRAIVKALNLMRGVVAFRLNVGAVEAEYRGRTRWVKFGIKGMADIGGWQTEYAGARKIARFLALEVKRPCKNPASKLTPQQAEYLDLVRQAGGIAAVVTSVKEALDAMAGN